MQYVKCASVPELVTSYGVFQDVLTIDTQSLKDVIGNQNMLNFKLKYWTYAVEDAQFFHI